MPAIALLPGLLLLPGVLLLPIASSCHREADDGRAEAAAAAAAPDRAAQRRACTEAVERAATECPPYSTPTVVDLARDGLAAALSITDLDRVATPIAGGLYVPSTPSLPRHDALGHVLVHNDECQVGCIVDCDVTTHALCLAQDHPACSFCGASASLAACEAFVTTCEP